MDLENLSARKSIRLINPVGLRERSQLTLAPRLESLEGKTVGFIDNIKPNAGLFLSYIEKMIRTDHPGIQVCSVRKDFTSSRLIADQLIERVDCVVNAWGD
jgi:hypothetical protein